MKSLNATGHAHCANSAKHDEREEYIYVAENDAGDIIGIAMGGPESSNHPLYTGAIYFLYLLPAYHRRGIGRQLTDQRRRAIGGTRDGFVAHPGPESEYPRPSFL